MMYAIALALVVVGGFIVWHDVNSYSHGLKSLLGMVFVVIGLVMGAGTIAAHYKREQCNRLFAMARTHSDSMQIAIRCYGPTDHTVTTMPVIIHGR